MAPRFAEIHIQFWDLFDNLSQHDLDNELATNGAVCTPYGVYGNFIMYTYASDGTLPNNNVFSQCSRDLIGALIVAKGADCFTGWSSSALFSGVVHNTSPRPGQCAVLWQQAD